MILVSGMPGTGKSTLAEWLALRLRLPLVCYDTIKSISLSNGGELSALFWRDCEAHLQAGEMFLADSLFTNQENERLEQLTHAYAYETIEIHLDCVPSRAWERFLMRNRRSDEPEGMRPKDITQEAFIAGTRQNRDFSFGTRRILVDTNDFDMVSYESIALELRNHCS